MIRSCTCPYCNTQLDVSSKADDQYITCHCGEVLYASNETDAHPVCYECSEEYDIVNDLYDQQLSCTCGVTFTVTRTVKTPPLAKKKAAEIVEAAPVKKRARRRSVEQSFDGENPALRFLAKEAPPEKSFAFPIFVILLILGGGGYYLYINKEQYPAVNDFIQKHIEPASENQSADGDQYASDGQSASESTPVEESKPAPVEPVVEETEAPVTDDSDDPFADSNI